MPYKSEAQRRYLHSQHPEIAAKWDAEIRAARKKQKVSKATKDYVPDPLHERRMDDEAMARAKTRQKYFSLTGSTLGLTGLGLLAAGAASKKNPARAAKMNRYATNASVTAGGIGALSGINFARIQGEESKRAREIKKSNYGTGYSQYSNAVDVDSVPVRTRVPDKNWREKSPYTISRKAADPERSREARARVYPALMGAGAVGTGALTVQEARRKVEPTRFLDKKILRNKPLRVGAAGAATAALVGGAIYNAKENNRRSYEGEWYPSRERH